MVKFNPFTGNFDLVGSTVAPPVTTFSSAAFRIFDSVDNTKQLAFNVAGVTTGTTRTLTVPNNNGTIATLENPQTFTNIITFGQSPRFLTNGFLNDINGNPLIGFPVAVASAINYVQVNNSPTTLNPALLAKTVGGDTNVGITFVPMGTGNMVFTNPALQARFTISSTSTAWVDGLNMSFGTTNGTRIGVATNQRLSFWNKTPIVQPTTAIAGAAFVAGAGAAVNDASTFGGYTIGQIANILIQTGLTA